MTATVGERDDIEETYKNMLGLVEKTEDRNDYDMKEKEEVMDKMIMMIKEGVRLRKKMIEEGKVEEKEKEEVINKLFGNEEKEVEEEIKLKQQRIEEDKSTGKTTRSWYS